MAQEELRKNEVQKMKNKIVLVTRDMVKEFVIKGLEADHVVTDMQKDEIGRQLEKSMKDEWLVNMRMDVKVSSNE